jgi:gliding motility-associated-like protein
MVTGYTYAWNVTGGTITLNTGNTIIVFWPSATTGTVSLTEGNTLTCDSTVSLSVIVGPQPAPVISGAPIVCTTTTTTYTISNPTPGNTYLWSVTGGAITGPSNTSSVNVSWTLPGNGTITVTESNSYGCDSTVQIPVTILTIPAPAISGSATGCAGQYITYSSTMVTGNTYAWNVTGGTIASNTGNTIVVFWPSATTGTVTLTEGNTLTCDSTVSLSVVVGPQPAPVIAGPLNVCTTTTSVYSVSNAIQGDSYIWTVTGGTIVGVLNNSFVQVSWSLPGQGTVSVTQSNSYGCDSTVSIPVNILILPTPSISGPANVCAGQVVTYTTTLVQGNTWQWNITGGSIIANSGNSVTVQWPLAGNGTVSLTESNTLWCDSTVILNVFTGIQPAPLIVGPTVICTDEHSSYSVVNPVPGNNYSWMVTGGTITGLPNGFGIDVLWNTPGLQTVTVMESNSSGCDSTVSFVVDVRLKPNPNLEGPPLACEMDRGFYSVQNFPGHSYIWSVTGGSVVGTVVNNAIEVLWTVPGQGSVSVRVISPLGCDSTVSKQVMVNPLPLTVISGPQVICEDESATYYTTLSGTNTYSWTVTGATITGSATGNYVNITFNTPGTANILLTEVTAAGCSRQVPYQVTVNSKPVVQISGSAIGCISNQQYNYTSVSQPNVNYQWSVTGGIIASGNGTSAIAVQWIAPGNNIITLTATNIITGCDNTFSIPVLAGALTPPVISAASLNGCAPVSMNFTGNTISSFYNYSWNFGDGTTTNAPNPTHNYFNPGTYNIQLIATNNTGCADTTSATVTVYPNPVAAFGLWYGTDIYYTSLSNLTLDNNSTGAVQYLWNFGNGDTSTQFEPDYEYNVPGTYTITLTVTNQYGCTDIFMQVIEVKVPEQIYIPNAFSPNNDSNNDYFNVSGLNITTLSISIFNRWGQSIYTSSNPYFRWDGTHNGRPAPEGVYVYSIAAKGFHGEDFKRQGTVTLVR